jgi:hypothetical protein
MRVSVVAERPAARVETPQRPRTWSVPLPGLIALAVSLGLTLALYGSSLRAGIMFDAALDLPRATNRTWFEVLTSAGPSPYFRPVTLLLWKVCYALLGRNDFVILHALSLACHALCGWLVYQLGRRLLDAPTGLVAAALFVWFPLSYQVVGFVDSLFHSLAALWVLVAGVLYWDARRRHDGRRMAGALVCGGLALFTHEGTAALLTPAVFGLEVLHRWRPRPQEVANQPPELAAVPPKTQAVGVSISGMWRWPAVFAAETTAFGLVWLAAPRWASTPKLDVPSLKLNVAYFVQALGYPLTMLLGHLPRWADGDVSEVLIVSGGAVAILLALARARGRLATAGFVLLWFGAAVLMPAALLPWPNYVIDAPRLLYTASAGIALLWAAALTPLRPRGLLGAVALVAILAESWAFGSIRERMLDQGAAIVRQIVDTAAQAGSEAGRIYVNVPAFLGPTTPDFLLGHSGVTMLPDYFGLDLEVAAATGRTLPIQSISYDDLARPWDEAYGLQGRHGGLAEATAAIAQGGGVYVTRFDPGTIRLEYEGQVGAGGSPPVVARFGDWAALSSAQAAVEGDTVVVRLTWLALRRAPADYTVFMHVVGDAPAPLAQSDGYPIAGLLPPREWPAGSGVEDVRRIPFPASARGKPLRVLIGLYDRARPDTRATAVDAAGAQLADGSYVIAIPAR